MGGSKRHHHDTIVFLAIPLLAEALVDLAVDFVFDASIFGGQLTNSQSNGLDKAIAAR